MDKNVILEMKNVSKRFPGVLALANVNLKLYHGEILALCGENGAGKSTLMKILSGSFSGNYEGDIFIEGEKVKLDSVEKAEELGVEMVYQETNMMFNNSVAENLFVGKLPGKGPWVDYKKLYADTDEYLKMVKLNVKPQDPVYKLNNGQLQMLSILRALSNHSRILVLDEPTGALTVNETKILMDILRKLREEGVSCIYISHKLEEVFEISDRIMVLRDGQLVSEHQTSEVDEKTLIEEMVGRKVENLFPKVHTSIGKEILRVEDVSVPHPTMRNKNIVENVGFSLHAGEILGIGGLVGAGRSELLGAIFGQITKGVTKKVYIDEKEVTIKKTKDAINAGIGFVTEERKQNGFIGLMSIRENITLASLADIRGKMFIKGKEESETVDYIFNKMRIKAPSMNTLVKNLSGGNQQKTVLGKWILKKPKILFIDEPTRGIDVGAKAEIYQLMGEMVKEGIGIVMISSDMPELVSMCDRCIVLSNGKVTGEFVSGEITQDKIMKAAIL